jgi:hypothetical protein
LPSGVKLGVPLTEACGLRNGMKRPVIVEYIIRRGWPLAKVVKARRVPSGETAGMVEMELNKVRRF